MSKITQSLVAHSGKYIVMPPHKAAQEGWANLAEPNVQLDGGDSPMEYPVNTKFVDFDRTFIYGYCSAKGHTNVKSNLGLFNTNTPVEYATWGGIAGAIGDTVCPFVTSTLDAYTEAIINLFAGGYMMPMFAGNVTYGCYRIVSSTVYAGGADGSTETDMVIEEPGLQAVVDADAAYCYIDKNPYTALRSNWLEYTQGDYQSVMGVTLIDPTAETYQWVQTWGPIHMLGDELGGKAGGLRSAYFNPDGTLEAGASVDLTTAHQPHYAGYIIAYTYYSSAGVYGALIQLQLER